MKNFKIYCDKASAYGKMKIFVEVDIKDHIIIETLVVHSLAVSKIVKMVLNQDDHDNSYNRDDIFNTAEKMPIVDTVKRDSGLLEE